jgi:hypothetical protein
LRKIHPFRYRKPPGQQAVLTKTEPLHGILSLKHQDPRTRKNTEDSERKKNITYKGKPIKITANFSIETLKARRAWIEVF